MKDTAVRLSKSFLMTFFYIILIGSLPAMFQGVKLAPGSYLKSLYNVIQDLLQPSHLVYMNHINVQVVTRPLFPFIISPWLYSLLLLFISLILALIISLILTYVTLQLPERLLNWIKGFFFLLESLPDILILGILQLSVVWIYEETHVLLFNIANYQSNSIALPILGLTIVPVTLLYRGMVLEVEQEYTKPYVEFARSKGLKNSVVLLKHILRNHLIHIFSHSKFIIWFMLSNLLMVEYIFNIQGLLRTMLYFGSPDVLTSGLLLLFLPIFLFFAIGQFLIEKLIGQPIEL